MNRIPKIAIVGRPNVGKSALFNRICKKRIAIVDEAEGITRDRLYCKSELFGYPFELIDTGGIDTRSKAEFHELVIRQAEIAIEEADYLIMVVDARIGVTVLDEELARRLLRTNKPLCLAVNKIDNKEQESLLYDFQALGITKMVGVSAVQDHNIAELLETTLGEARDQAFEDEEERGIRVAIVGRPNVGKSSLMNYLLEDDRCIVSPIAGTTRDSIDITFENEGQTYTLIDTAGIRRKSAEHEVVEKFAAIRTKDAIERADVCILMLDAQQGITSQDKRIANRIEEEGKGCIILLNKWDLVKGFRMEHCFQDIKEESAFLNYCPKLFVSATSGRNLDKIFSLAKEVYENAKTRIPTPKLNSFIESAMQKNHPPMLRGKRLRVYYMAQVAVEPPRYIMFVNYPDLMAESYRRYLYNQFRLAFPYTGVPLTFHLRGKEKKGNNA